MIEVCKDCPDRVVGCHGKCEKYLAAKAECQSRAALLAKQRKGDKDIDDYNAQRSHTLKKRYKRRGL